MNVTAATVKALRERTGVGIMDCKKALQQTDGDIEQAIEDMRKSGIAKAAKKAGRIATEGLVIIKQGSEPDCAVIVEVNSETDFVTKDPKFTGFCNQVASVALDKQPADIDTLMSYTVADGAQTIEECRQQLVATVGENISVRRFFVLVTDTSDSVLGYYLHGARIGVIVMLKGGDVSLAKDIAMHIAASNPLCVSEQDMPKDILAKEREILLAQAQTNDKPVEIINKIVDGRVKKFLKEVTLLQQPFVKDSDQIVADLLKTRGATVKSYFRYEVGEGLEKQESNFAKDVMAQVREDR